jgi:hypothetical protein
MKTSTRTAILFFILLSFGCSTTAQFRLPPDTAVMVKNKKFTPEKDGYADVEVSPFFWTGISYKLVKGNKIVQEGRLKSHFRIAALLWPPAAVLYWPKGFGADCYDFTAENSKADPPTCESINHGNKKRQQMLESAF